MTVPPDVELHRRGIPPKRLAAARADLHLVDVLRRRLADMKLPDPLHGAVSCEDVHGRTLQQVTTTIVHWHVLAASVPPAG